jgi:hypothetical protein
MSIAGDRNLLCPQSIEVENFGLATEERELGN